MADWDTSKPADDDIVSQYPANERSARSAVKTNFGVDHHDTDDADVGKHEHVTLLQKGSDPSTPATDQGILYQKDDGGNGEAFYKDEAGNVVQMTKAGAMQAFPSGTKMLFAQASPPAGWTQDISKNDRVMRVVSGTGGGTGGSWTISGLSVGNTTLSLSQIPAHTHLTVKTGSTSTGSPNLGASEPVIENNQTGGDSGYILNGAGGTANVGQSSSAGGGNSHSHSISHDGNWRPAYLDIIQASKD